MVDQVLGGDTQAQSETSFMICYVYLVSMFMQAYSSIMTEGP